MAASTAVGPVAWIESRGLLVESALKKPRHTMVEWMRVRGSDLIGSMGHPK
jgi:hypothetical protein